MIPDKIFLPDSSETSILFPPNMDYPFFESVRYAGFHHRTKEFSLANAIFLAEASFLAYNHPSFVKYVFYYGGFDEVIPFMGKTVAGCFAAKKSNAIVVAFRGTELTFPSAIPGFIADLQFSLTYEKNGCKVHSGFQAVLDEIWDGENMLHAYLVKQKEKNPSIKIFFTGHSLGGALALIAASRFQDIDAIYTYGCPRAGNNDFCDTIKAKVYRIVNNNDIVTELPPETLAITKSGDRYSHIGELKFIDAEGRIKNKTGNKFAVDLIARKYSYSSFLVFEELMLHLKRTKSSDFIDHSPYYYCAKLWNAYYEKHVKKQKKHLPLFKHKFIK